MPPGHLHPDSHSGPACMLCITHSVVAAVAIERRSPSLVCAGFCDRLCGRRVPSAATAIPASKPSPVGSLLYQAFFVCMCVCLGFFTNTKQRRDRFVAKNPAAAAFSETPSSWRRRAYVNVHPLGRRAFLESRRLYSCATAQIDDLRWCSSPFSVCPFVLLFVPRTKLLFLDLDKTSPKENG